LPSQRSSIARAYSSKEDPGGDFRVDRAIVRAGYGGAILILASRFRSYKIVVFAQALSVHRAYSSRGSHRMARARKEAKFEVFGQEMVEKIVAKSGSSGRVYLPPDWIGKRVKVIRVD